MPEATPDATPAAEATATQAPALRRPASCGELFRVFTRLALQGFGGVLPIAHHELVDRERWLDNAQFVELLSAGQVLPGPNIVNVALMFGDRHFGWRGALAAAAGLLVLPLAIVMAMALAYQQWQHLPAVAGALRGVGVVAAGLVFATAFKLAGTLGNNPLGRNTAWLLAAATLVLVGFVRLPMVGVVVGIGGLGMALAARRLKTSARPGERQ